VPRVRMALLVLIAAIALAVTPAATARDSEASRTAATTIRVSGGEFFFRLSAKSARRGTIIFRFRNIGSVKHDFKIAGKKTPLIAGGRSAPPLSVTIKKPGRYKFLCTVPGHAAAGMRGTFTVR
jgi:plastocyanin